MDETKKCIECLQIKPRSEYWCGAKGTNRLISRCKKCHVVKRREYAYNRPQREKKLRGFAALDAEIQAGILEMMNQDPQPKKKAVADKFNIKYPTFCQWCKKGWVK